MELKDLIAVRALATKGSVTAAAEELNTVQSNLTTRIRQLEDRLHVRLFQRHARGVVPTEAGERLLAYADQILALTGEATRVMQQMAGVDAPITIGCNESTAALRLPPMLATYCKQNPNLNVSIKTAVTADLVRQTFEKKLDGALIIGPAEHRELEVETVGVEELVLVTPGNGRTVPCGDTMLTFRTGCGYRRVLENFLQTKSVNQSKFLELGTIEGILGGVKEGLGFSLLPLIALGFDRNQPNFRCTRLPPPYDSAPVQFVHRRDTPFQTEMRRFIAVARIHFLASEQEAIATAPSIEPAASLQIAKQRIELDPEPLALLAPGS